MLQRAGRTVLMRRRERCCAASAEVLAARTACCVDASQDCLVAECACCARRRASRCCCRSDARAAAASSDSESVAFTLAASSSCTTHKQAGTSAGWSACVGTVVAFTWYLNVCFVLHIAHHYYCHCYCQACVRNECWTCQPRLCTCVESCAAATEVRLPCVNHTKMPLKAQKPTCLRC
jgi:hypothetical protein